MFLLPLWAKSADNKLRLLILFFPENGLWHFMQIVYFGNNMHLQYARNQASFVSFGANLHEMSKAFSWKNKKNISKCCLLKFLPHMLSLQWSTFTTRWANSADKKVMIFSQFSQKTGWHFMQIVSTANNLHKMPNPVF